MAQQGTGTLMDPQIRQRCVCPMTDCTYVVRAYTQVLQEAWEEVRNPRPEVQSETREASAQRLLDDARDGVIPDRDDNGAIRMRPAPNQDRLPKGEKLIQLIQESMSLHTRPPTNRTRCPTGPRYQPGVSADSFFRHFR